MKAEQIKILTEKLREISEIGESFSYIGYELPKKKTDGNILIISDLDESGDCLKINLVEFRVIGATDISALRVKSFVDLLDEKIPTFFSLGFSKITKVDESRIILDQNGRFEKVLTFNIY